MGSETTTSDKAAPGALRLSARSLLGPFASGGLRLARARAVLRNRTGQPLTIVAAAVSPVIDERSGLAAGAGSLTVDVAPGLVASGGAIEVTIAGSAPARPGRYAADLDVECGGLYHAAHGLALYSHRVCPPPTP